MIRDVHALGPIYRLMLRYLVVVEDTEDGYVVRDLRTEPPLEAGPFLTVGEIEAYLESREVTR